MTRAIFIFYVAAFALGALGMALAPSRPGRWIKFATYFAITAIVLASASFGSPAFPALVAVIVSVGACELYRVRRRLTPAVWIVYAAVAAGAMLFAWTAAPPAAVFVYLIVAVFDGFSQIAGQLAGRHPLAPRISPGKTVEGTAGGLLAATVTALLLHVPLAATLLLSAAALAGDLAASWVKRRAGIKDFSAILPGHGGILDRFDSFLPAAALACLLM